MPIKIDVPFHPSEAELQSCLQDIVRIAKDMEKHGFTADIREKDRFGYWKWCYAEKSMNVLTTLIGQARQHLEHIDHTRHYSS